MTLQQAKAFTLKALRRPQMFSWRWADMTNQHFTLGSLVKHKNRWYKVIAVNTKDETFMGI